MPMWGTVSRQLFFTDAYQEFQWCDYAENLTEIYF